MANFLTNVTKKLTKDGYEVESYSAPPKWWISTGNHVLNKIVSNNFYNGIPQGRLTALVGPSQSGKSFLLCNIMKAAQDENAIIIALDSENALDDVFVSSIGVDTNKDYRHIHVNLISDVTSVTSTIINGYKNEYPETNEDNPKLLIAIDSLDMLVTDTEETNFNKQGIIKGDQGQKNKQLKALLRELVHSIKHSDITIVVTDQVYRNQDTLNGEGVWMVKDAVKYSLSQIIMLTRLKLKDGSDSRQVTGMKMKCEDYKSRFAKPHQSVTIEVPYDTGMDPYNGLLAVAVELGVVSRGGAWYTFNDNKFQSKHFSEYAEEILKVCEQASSKFLEAVIEDDEIEVVESQETRIKRLAEKMEKNSK